MGTGRMRGLKIVVLGALAGATGIAGCGGGQAGQAPPAPAVTVAPVEERNIVEWDEWSGRLQAVDSVEIRPRVSGYIKRVAFVEGAEVKKGAVLFEIDPRPYQAELQRARAELSQAQSGASLAARNLTRAKSLLESDAITQQDFERSHNEGERGTASVAVARAAVAVAQLNLEWTRVRSPINGRVGRAEVTAGNLVQAGAPGGARLTTVVSLDPVHVSFEADERSYLKYAARARQDGAAPGSRRTPVELGLAHEEGFPHKGVVDFVDNQLDPRTGTVRARAVFANKDRLFVPGLFARVRLEGGSARRATLVSDRAVGTDQDKKFVLVLKADSTVEYRPVELGRLIDGYRIINGGLKAGEKIVVNGLQRARPGMKVAATNGPMMASASLTPGPR
jgi:RND family efflux transporter MFP subunit